MAGRPRVNVLSDTVGETMTKQSMAMETDINAIVARHIAHGVPFPEGDTAVYGDFSDGLTYHEACNAVLEAQATFMLLPAAVRDYCDNDPGRFLDLVHDPSKRADMEALGLVPQAVPAVPVLEPVPVPEPPNPAPPADPVP